MAESSAIAAFLAAAALGPPLSLAQEALVGGARYYLETPPGGPDWGVRFVVTLLYPK